MNLNSIFCPRVLKCRGRFAEGGSLVLADVLFRDITFKFSFDLFQVMRFDLEIFTVRVLVKVYFYDSLPVKFLIFYSYYSA